MGRPPPTITLDTTAIANMVENVFNNSPMMFTPLNREESIQLASHVMVVSPPQQLLASVASCQWDTYVLTIHPAKKLRQAS